MIFDPFRIVELDQTFRKNREEAQAHNDPTGMVKARIAMAAEQKEETNKIIAARTAKVKQLLKLGYNRSEIAERLNMNPYTIDTVISRIGREDEQMDRIRLGWKRGSGGYVCLTPGLPTKT
jgi:DNA-binding NarL/FixJ family response regulator